MCGVPIPVRRFCKRLGLSGSSDGWHAALEARDFSRGRLHQCVSQPDVQSFVGAIAGKHGNGLFVATCRFSQKAQEYAQLHHIILIDGERLANLAIEYDFCMTTRKTYKIRAIDEDAFAEYKMM